MRHSKQQLKKKDFQRSAQRIEELQRKIASLPPHPLPKKILVGHWRYLRVRADVLRSSVGKQVAQVVEHCNHWVLGKKKHSDSYVSSTEIAVSPTKTSFTQGQGLRPLGQSQYLAASFPSFFEKKWFRVVESYHRAGTKNIPVRRYFPQIPPHMLEFAYKPAYMTEEHIPSSEMSSELKRLYDFMRANHGWEKISGRHADEWDLNFTRTRLLDRISRREAKEAVFQEEA